MVDLPSICLTGWLQEVYREGSPEPSPARSPSPPRRVPAPPRFSSPPPPRVLERRGHHRPCWEGFQFEMRGVGLSEPELKHLYRLQTESLMPLEPVESTPTYPRPLEACSASSVSMPRSPRMPSWTRFQEVMSGLGLTTPELAELYREQWNAVAGVETWEDRTPQGTEPVTSSSRRSAPPPPAYSSHVVPSPADQAVPAKGGPAKGAGGGGPTSAAASPSTPIAEEDVHVHLLHSSNNEEGPGSISWQSFQKMMAGRGLSRPDMVLMYRGWLAGDFASYLLSQVQPGGQSSEPTFPPEPLLQAARHSDASPSAPERPRSRSRRKGRRNRSRYRRPGGDDRVHVEADLPEPTRVLKAPEDPWAKLDDAIFIAQEGEEDEALLERVYKERARRKMEQLAEAHARREQDGGGGESQGDDDEGHPRDSKGGKRYASPTFARTRATAGKLPVSSASRSRPSPSDTAKSWVWEAEEGDIVLPPRGSSSWFDDPPLPPSASGQLHSPSPPSSPGDQGDERDQSFFSPSPTTSPHRAWSPPSPTQDWMPSPVSDYLYGSSRPEELVEEDLSPRGVLRSSPVEATPASPQRPRSAEKDRRDSSPVRLQVSE